VSWIAGETVKVEAKSRMCCGLSTIDKGKRAGFVNGDECVDEQVYASMNVLSEPNKTSGGGVDRGV
jgi:hypothetical protein